MEKWVIYIIWIGILIIPIASFVVPIVLVERKLKTV